MRFSTQRRKAKKKQSSGPIRARSKYMELVSSAGIRASKSRRTLGFTFNSLRKRREFFNQSSAYQIKAKARNFWHTIEGRSN